MSAIGGLVKNITAAVNDKTQNASSLAQAKQLEALLTAIALKNPKELDKDMKRIEARHAAGELSGDNYSELQTIFQKAQAGDWARNLCSTAKHDKSSWTRTT